MQHPDIDDGQLQDTGHQHAPGHVPGSRKWWRADVERVEQRADHHHVEENRRDGGSEEMMQRIQHAAHHRRQRHAHQIGKHHRRHAHRDRHLVGVVGKARRNDKSNQQRHAEFHHHRDQEQHGKQHAEDFLGKALCTVDAVRLDLLGKQRHEGSIESALGKKPAKQIGKAEGGVEDVGHRPGTERRRHQRFAGETEHAAAERRATDGRKFTYETHAAEPAFSS